MQNQAGELVECSQSNFFIVRDGQVLTPPLAAGLLPGITREFVLELADELGLPAREAQADAGRPRDRRRGVHHWHHARGDARRRRRRPADRRAELPGRVSQQLLDVSARARGRA